MGLEGRGNVRHNRWNVGFNDIVGGLDAVRACDISGQGGRGAKNKLCDVGESQCADNILDVSEGLRNAIGIATEKRL